jgi:hypothetical protein
MSLFALLLQSLSSLIVNHNRFLLPVCKLLQKTTSEPKQITSEKAIMLAISQNHINLNEPLEWWLSAKALR